jgi:hypothetical protein
MVPLIAPYVCAAMQYKIDVTPRELHSINEWNLAEPFDLSTKNRITSYTYCVYCAKDYTNKLGKRLQQ